MKTITARSPHDSLSFSRRYFHWKKKVTEDEEDDMEEILAVDSSKSEDITPHKSDSLPRFPLQHSRSARTATTPRKTKLPAVAVSKLRSALALGRVGRAPGLGTKVVGTLFGHRRGHVQFAFQEDFKLGPPFLVQLATPTSILVKEMASGLVRIALECDKKPMIKKGFKLLEEPIWRTYCNGKKCGYAMRRDCGPPEWKVLNAIGPISMGAGVLPGPGPETDAEGEMMYMRAKFERVVGSKDSEAFYMISPDGHGGPELSIYLLRV